MNFHDVTKQKIHYFLLGWTRLYKTIFFACIDLCCIFSIWLNFILKCRIQMSLETAEKFSKHRTRMVIFDCLWTEWIHLHQGTFFGFLVPFFRVDPFPEHIQKPNRQSQKRNRLCPLCELRKLNFLLASGQLHRISIQSY